MIELIKTPNGVNGMIIERYPLLNEPGRTMCVFEKNGKYYGHILKDRTEKAPAMFVFETPRFDSLDELKAEYPVKELTE